MRLGLVSGMAALTLAVSAFAQSPVRATMSTSTTTPVVDTPWRYTITARDGRGRPAAAKAKLQILFGATVVGCWKATAMTPCSGARAGTWIPFKGRRTDTLTWPAQSVGVKLTFQAIVAIGGRTIRLRTPVTVQPAP